MLAGCQAPPPVASLEDVLPPARTMAQQAERRGDWPAAAQHWLRAREAEPQDRAVALSLIRAMRLSGSCGPAATHLAQLLGKDANDTDALLENAKCHLVSGRPEAAEAVLATILASRPDWWEAETTLAVALDRTGRHADALPHHDRAMALAPDKAIVAANKALSLALSGKLAEGIALMRQASASPSAPARVRMNLAALEAMAGDGDRAATIASQEALGDRADNVATLKGIARGTRRTGGTP